ncbi:hypothetical protein DX912_03405 [Lysobacter soli]|uniref:Uncharacterized protein n=1 Tax=Lysobacter soli TaxID=453783 RepID=A0A3D8VHL2_9GAMM|nr:hypothetical protein DX912_03405 [Lysobacter soli]
MIAGKPAEPKTIRSWLPSGLAMRRSPGAGGVSAAKLAMSSGDWPVANFAGRRCSFDAPKLRK